MTREQGFGCMGFSAFYKSAIETSEEQALAVLKHAYDSGVRLFNTATFYGPLNEEGYGANLRLLAKFLKMIDRSSIQLMVKVGMDTRARVEQTGRVWINRADYGGIMEDVKYAMETLDVEYIDIVVLCRVSPAVPIEESMGAMKDLVEQGKARLIGLSEASAATIARAVQVAPLYCIEQEWSLWTRDIEQEILPICRQHGIKIVAYSPLGRGFLSGEIRSREASDLDPRDYRSFGQPRFSDINLACNLKLVDGLEAIVQRHPGTTKAQIALAWVHAQGDDVIPIPGTTKISHFDSNWKAKDIILTEDDLKEIDKLFHPDHVMGDRYAHMGLTFHGNR